MLRKYKPIEPGDVFARLTVTKSLPPMPTSTGNKPMWECVCICGSTIKVLDYHLKSGNTKSCGCLQREIMSERATHGISKTSIYYIWCMMIQRCSNPNEGSFERYGGLGVKVCDEWLVFENFYRDMGERPTKNHSIDRINSSKGYQPDNCRWATPSEQNFNRRRKTKTKSGITGVRQVRNGNWAADISKNNKRIYLGTFKTKDEAVAARKDAEARLYPEYANNLEGK